MSIGKKKNLFLLTEKAVCVWTRGQNIQEIIHFAKYLQKCGHSLSRKKYIRCLFHFIPLQLQQESWLITRFCSKASSSLQQCFVLNHRNLKLMFTTHKILKAGEKKRRFLQNQNVYTPGLSHSNYITGNVMSTLFPNLKYIISFRPKGDIHVCIISEDQQTH